jgi:hypothetical protein
MADHEGLICQALSQRRAWQALVEGTKPAAILIYKLELALLSNPQF